MNNEDNRHMANESYVMPADFPQQMVRESVEKAKSERMGHDSSCAIMQSCAEGIRCTCGYETDYYGLKRVSAWPLHQRHRGDGFMTRDDKGHMSWLPKAVFEETYMPTDAMDFGRALQAMRDGHRVIRRDEVSAELRIENGTIIGCYENGEPLYTFIDGHFDEEDILATDWGIV